MYSHWFRFFGIGIGVGIVVGDGVCSGICVGIGIGICIISISQHLVPSGIICGHPGESGSIWQHQILFEWPSATLETKNMR